MKEEKTGVANNSSRAGCAVCYVGEITPHVYKRFPEHLFAYKTADIFQSFRIVGQVD